MRDDLGPVTAEGLTRRSSVPPHVVDVRRIWQLEARRQRRRHRVGLVLGVATVLVLAVAFMLVAVTG